MGDVLDGGFFRISWRRNRYSVNTAGLGWNRVTVVTYEVRERNLEGLFKSRQHQLETFSGALGEPTYSPAFQDSQPNEVPRHLTEKVQKSSKAEM